MSIGLVIGTFVTYFVGVLAATWVIDLHIREHGNYSAQALAEINEKGHPLLVTGLLSWLAFIGWLLRYGYVRYARRHRAHSRV